MSKFQYYTTKQIVNFFLEQGKEGECWDFKQEWHDDIQTLIKDIVCFANTMHDENCYMIFGVSDDLKITGMKKTRRKQADIIDAISKLMFAGDNYPKIEVQTVTIDNIQIDVLIVFNVTNTPIYLKTQYGEMRPGCIYLRTGDKNTPNGGNADIADIESLWKKRFGLTKSQLEFIYDRMSNKVEWNRIDNDFYNIYHPEYTISIIDEDTDTQPAFYSYAMINNNTSYEELLIKYQNTVLESYRIVLLDGGRLQIPIPELGFLCHGEYGLHNKYDYNFYVCGSKKYKLFRFLYDGSNGEQRYSFAHLQDVIIFYYNEEERLAFETYIEEYQELLEEKINSITHFNHIKVKNASQIDAYRERLKVGYALNQLLISWRNKMDTNN